MTTYLRLRTGSVGALRRGHTAGAADQPRVPAGSPEGGQFGEGGGGDGSVRDLVAREGRNPDAVRAKAEHRISEVIGGNTEGETIVDLGGIAPELAGVVADRVEAFAGEFPGVAAGMDGIIASMDMENGTLAQVDRSERWGSPAILLNEDHWASTDAFNAALLKDSGAVMSAQGVIDHELGHVLSYSAPDHGSEGSRAIWTDTTGISSYAESNPHEAFAEAFSLRQSAEADGRTEYLLDKTLQADMNDAIAEAKDRTASVAAAPRPPTDVAVFLKDHSEHLCTGYPARAPGRAAALARVVARGKVAYSEDQARDDQGRWTSDGGGGSSTEKDVTHYVEQLYKGEKVLVPADQVATLLDELAARAADAKEAGEQAPNFNLCDVSVEGANLFCSDSFGIERQDMPQLAGDVIPGSPADIEHPGEGNIDGTAAFITALAGEGVTFTSETVPAQYLKATQNELNGAKVGGIMGAIESGKLDPLATPIFVSKENYVLDGHHRWAGAVGAEYADGKPDEDIRMAVTKVDMPILDLVAFANQWSKDYGIAQAGV